MPVLRIVLADEQKLFIEGLRLLLTQIKNPVLNVVNHAHSGKDLIEILKESTIDLVFLDLNLKSPDGLELIRILKDESPKTLVCVLTHYRDPKYVKESFQKGADGYFLKSGSVDEIAECVVAMRKGERYLTQGLFITPPRKTENELKEEDDKYEDNFMIRQKLTAREMEVLKLIVDAKSNRQIAQDLFISDQTVGVHRKNIMRKLGVRNTISLIKFALEHQLV